MSRKLGMASVGRVASGFSGLRHQLVAIETRLHQWNQIRILPSLPIEEGMKDVQEGRLF